MPRDPDDDLRLVQAWLDGDRRACDNLLAAYYDSVYRFFEVKVPASAADLTQTTMLACVKGVRTFEARASFRTYLFAIARRQLAYHLREQMRRQATQHDPEQLPASRTTASRLVARKEEQRLLLHGLALLGEEQRAALLLYYWENLSTAEVGDVLSISASAVSSRLLRARHALHEAIDGATSQPAMAQRVLADLEGWLASLPNATPIGPPRP